jgi:hypothetical protein
MTSGRTMPSPELNMPTKKKTEAADNADETHARHHGAPSMTPSVRPKTKPAAAPQPPSHSPQVLVICRNKCASFPCFFNLEPLRCEPPSSLRCPSQLRTLLFMCILVCWPGLTEISHCPQTLALYFVLSWPMASTPP